MAARQIRTLAAGLILTFAVPAAGRGSDDAENYVRARLVRMPVLLEERAAGGCDDIVLDEIELTEDRVEVRLTHFEPRRLPALHAILVDTGVEMLDVLQEVRRVVAAYEAGLPPDEPILLATFDDDLALRSPPSLDRLRFRAALEWIEIGWGSRLWDSSLQMIHHLASRPERKVLIVLTDACQTGRVRAGEAQVVLEAAGRVDSLVVFPVWLDHPPACEPGDDGTVLALKQLAKRTGGAFQGARSAELLDGVLEAIRERTARERVLTYEPVTLGEGSRGRQIRFRTDRACRITIAGPIDRYGGADRRDPSRSPVSGRETLLRPFALSSNGERAVGRVRDVLRDAGFLAVPTTPESRAFLGRAYVDSTSRRTAARQVYVAAPPLEQVLREITTPEDALAFAWTAALEEAGGDPERVPVTWSALPYLVNGTTLLETRESIANALGARADYQHWAREKVRGERLRDIDERIAAAETGVDIPRLGLLRETLRMHSWEPDRLELQTHLAGWLGDITIMELSNRIERRLASRLLAEGAEAAGQAERVWKTMAGWFPPPTNVRVIGIQVPVYDPGQDAIGFYRVLLRPPYSAEFGAGLISPLEEKLIRASGGVEDATLYSHLRTMNFSTDTALGVRLVRWLLEQPSVARQLGAGFHVHAVRYAHATPRNLLALFVARGYVAPTADEAPYLARQVTLVLSPRDAPGNLFPVSAYFARSPHAADGFDRDPVCILLSAEPPPGDTSARLIAALVEVQLQREVPCLLREPPAPSTVGRTAHAVP